MPNSAACLKRGGWRADDGLKNLGLVSGLFLSRCGRIAT